MASARNDALLARTVEGSVNHYCDQRVKCTATDKGLADRLGGHSYNIISNSDRDEIYLRELRPPDHRLDNKGRHTVHFFGSRRRKFAGDERGLVAETLKHPDAHPRERALAQRRAELQLAQTENYQSYAGFQQRCGDSFFRPAQPKKYQVHNARYANEAEKLRPRITSRDDWKQRRGETMQHSHTVPSLSIADPAASLDRAVREDIRKEVSQRQLESAHFAPRMTANTYSTSMDAAPVGQQMAGGQRHCSVSRLENHDFGVVRKNNHFSSEDKLTRADPYYMRPRLGITNNSVKYDIVSNERRWFKY